MWFATMWPSYMTHHYIIMKLNAKVTPDSVNDSVLSVEYVYSYLFDFSLINYLLLRSHIKCIDNLARYMGHSIERTSTNLQ